MIDEKIYILLAEVKKQICDWHICTLSKAVLWLQHPIMLHPESSPPAGSHQTKGSAQGVWETERKKSRRSDEWRVDAEEEKVNKRWTDCNIFKKGKKRSKRHDPEARRPSLPLNSPSVTFRAAVYHAWVLTGNINMAYRDSYQCRKCDIHYSGIPALHSLSQQYRHWVYFLSNE